MITSRLAALGVVAPNEGNRSGREADVGLGGNRNVLKRRELEVGSLGSTPTRFRHLLLVSMSYR